MNLILLTILVTHYPIIVFILITIYQITHPINIITPIVYFIINYHFQSFTNLIDQSILFNNPPIIFNLFQLIYSYILIIEFIIIYHIQISIHYIIFDNFHLYYLILFIITIHTKFSILIDIIHIMNVNYLIVPMF